MSSLDPLHPHGPSPAVEAANRAPTGLAAVPPAPRTPSRRARELQYGFEPGGFVNALMGCVFLISGSFFTYVLCSPMPADFALAVASSVTEGSVVASRIDKQTSVNRRNPTLVTVAYRVADAPYETTSSSLDESRNFHVGARASVEYLPFAPSIARLAGTTRSPGGYLPLLALLFPLAGLAMLSAALGPRAGRRRALVRGTPTLGTVTSLEIDETTKIDGRSPWRVGWSFEDANGRTFFGSASAVDRAALGEVFVDAPIVVVYDPRNPKANAMWCE